MRKRIERARLRRMGMRTDDVEVYGFGDAVPLAAAPDYLGYQLYTDHVRPRLNPRESHAVTSNKWIFYRLMSGFGVPVPETFGLYHRHHGLTWAGEPLRTPEALLALLAAHRPDGLVLKPAGGEQGGGVRIVRAIDHDAGVGVLPGGRRIELADLVAEVPPLEGSGGYPGTIVQRLAEQHPDLARINPHTPNTVRVLTLVVDGEVAVLRAVARIGRAGETVDAWSRGGAAVAVDVATGEMGEGITRIDHGGHRLRRDPGTGVEFTGLRVPCWDAVLATCTRAAALLPGTRSLGWDVLVTADGPVVVEANRGWNLQLSQVHGGMLADPVFRQAIVDAGVDLPAAVPRSPVDVALAKRLVRRSLRRLRLRRR